MTLERPVWAPAPIVAIVGWKNAGKTSVVEALVSILTSRGLDVATVKHAHHSFDVDHEGTDSARHRAAGASQVAIVSRTRSAVMREHGENGEPALEDVVALLQPCDVIIVEGYKGAAIPKIELRRRGAVSDASIAERDPYVIAVVADHPQPGERLPVLDMGAPAALADFILETLSETGTDEGKQKAPAGKQASF